MGVNDVNETRPLMTSRQKIEWFVGAQLRQAAMSRGDMLARLALQWMPQLLGKLPEDPDVLDKQLALYAQLLLELRSDTADRLAIVAARPPTPTVAADAAEETP